jgi:hypothetical protein
MGELHLSPDLERHEPGPSFDTIEEYRFDWFEPVGLPLLAYNN